MKVGILALQGDFQSHAEKLRELGIESCYVKKAQELFGIDALILPGGESTTLLTLIDDEFKAALSEILRRGLPTMATCAGLILLARDVTNPTQSSLGVLDIEVARNAYGRQVDSFIASDLNWTIDSEKILADLKQPPPTVAPEAVFIRAPRISRVGSEVQVMLERGGEAVAVLQENIIGITFHPELTSTSGGIYEILFALIRRRQST